MEIKLRKNFKNEIFVFEFHEKNEPEALFEMLKDLASYSEEDDMPYKVINETVKILESRCDDKYAHDDVVLSSMLFPREMSAFCMALIFGSSNRYRKLLNEVADTQEQYSHFLKEHIALQKEIIGAEGF